MSPIAPHSYTRRSRLFSACSHEAIGQTITAMRVGSKRWCLVKERGVKTTIILGIPHEVSLSTVLIVCFCAVLLLLGSLFLAYAFLEQRFCFDTYDPTSVATIRMSVRRTMRGMKTSTKRKSSGVDNRDGQPRHVELERSQNRNHIKYSSTPLTVVSSSRSSLSFQPDVTGSTRALSTEPPGPAPASTTSVLLLPKISLKPTAAKSSTSWVAQAQNC